MATPMHQVSPSTDFNMMLMGKSGHGKSSTGNSILGTRAFQAIGGVKSVTKAYQVAYRKFEGRVIKVVDIPGVCDADTDSEEEQTDLVVKAIREGLSLFPMGFSALVLVLSYGARFTKEEQYAIQALKKMLGDDILKKHTVCIFTRGDDFEFDHGTEDFQTWIRQQDGPLKEILDEINYRVVLFHNRTTNEDKKNAQVKQLLGNIDDKLTPYLFDKFEAAEKLGKEEREEVMLLEEYSKKVGLIKTDIKNVMGSSAHDKSMLDTMRKEIEEMINDISSKKNKPRSKLTKELELMKESIIKIKTLIEKEEQAKFEEEQMKKKIEAQEQQMQQEREEYESRMREQEEATKQAKLEQEQIRKKIENQEQQMQQERKDNKARMREQKEATEQAKSEQKELKNKIKDQEKRIQQEKEDNESLMQEQLQSIELKEKESKENYERQQKESKENYERQQKESKENYERQQKESNDRLLELKKKQMEEEDERQHQEEITRRERDEEKRKLEQRAEAAESEVHEGRKKGGFFRKLGKALTKPLKFIGKVLS